MLKNDDEEYKKQVMDNINYIFFGFITIKPYSIFRKIML